MSHPNHNFAFRQVPRNHANHSSVPTGNENDYSRHIVPRASPSQSHQQKTVVRGTGPALRQNSNMTNGSNGTATSKDMLIQKLESAMAGLRKNRDQDYRQKVEAEERLRLVQEEKETLERSVMDLKSKIQNICQEQFKTQASLGPLEEIEVPELRRKARFQHEELMRARSKIQEQTQAIKETAQERGTNLEAIRRLANESRLKLEAMKKKKNSCSNNSEYTLGLSVLPLEKQKEGLVRELNCLMFEWDAFPKLLEEKAEIYRIESRRLSEENNQLIQKLEQYGIPLPCAANDAPNDTVLQDADKTSPFTQTQDEDAPMVDSEPVT